MVIFGAEKGGVIGGGMKGSCGIGKVLCFDFGDDYRVLTLC